MEDRNEVLIGMAVILVFTCVTALAIHKWWQQRRVREVEIWVREYLYDRYGILPHQLHINCSSDLLWPVLVNFDAPLTGSRHSLQFDCGGRQQTWVRRTEKEEHR